MRGVIYLDMLLAVNFILDFFLLQGARRLSGSSTSRARTLLGTGLASLFSLAVLLPPLPLPAQLLIQLAGSLLPVGAAFRFSGIKQFLQGSAWFFLLNLLLAGLVFFVSVHLSPVGIEMNNMAFYLDISPVVLVLCVLAVYLTLQLLCVVFGRPGALQGLELELQLDGARVKGQLLLDTGFSLRDPLGGKPCILLSYPQVAGQLSDRMRRALAQYFSGQTPQLAGCPPVRMIPCSGVEGEGLLPAFCCAAGTLRSGSQTAEVDGLPVAFSRGPMADRRWDGLVGMELAQPII